MQNGRIIVFFVHLIFGLYFLNTGFNFVPIPEAFSTFDKWIISIGGIFVLLGGINYLRTGRRVVRQ